METLKITQEFLENQRTIVDKTADDFVLELSNRLSRKDLYLFLRILLDQFTLTDGHKLDKEAEAYVRKIAKLPEWADQELIKKGQYFFKLHGPEICLALFLKSLPSTYCCWKGARVVHDSGRLTNHSGNLAPFTRRLIETSKFVLNVCADDGLAENGVGVFAAAKVRTLHAFIRHFLKNKGWDVAKFGEPINQEDLAGTMLAFSAYVIEGLERFGIKVSKEEKEAYYHIWKIIGHIMGVEKTLILDDYEEAEALGQAILDHQKGASKEGRELTAACIEYAQSLMPFGLFKFFPQNLMYLMMGKELSEMGNIKRSKNIFLRFLVQLFLLTLKVSEWLKHHIGFIRRLAHWLNPKILNWLLKKFLKDLNQPFTPEIIQNEVNVLTANRPK